MKNDELYNIWAATYDTNENKTRDLDLKITQEVLKEYEFEQVLEIGAGTGKNTAWLAHKAKHITAIDFSLEMLKLLQQKVKGAAVEIFESDLNQKWPLKDEQVDLVLANLVLEHIENLEPIFAEAARVMKPQGTFFVSELHPFKQYMGSKASFEQNGERVSLNCYVHHISDYIEQAKKAGLHCVKWQEWFDNEDRTKPPRLVSFIFELATY
ncbi:class I SAM-dependent methyltransferase [Aureispira anguillae]|uniref:Class I SAM-dependent methyltransferase n=1 Tax=Aureispira anguillae TaxID=2864201 RepID=A0A915YFB9_9BACT|nr:class I SAM-dependent methyltransferase [Aureispira anguillae]BDS11958.1 class I SAM-dependent methyltransferase [Aureispira anguillae]